MDLTNYTKSGKFDRNILVLGQTACGKTTFVHNLGKNKLFGKIKDVSWITKIVLPKEREQNICSCFDVSVEFFDPQNIDEFDVIIENFQRPKNRTLTVFSEKTLYLIGLLPWTTLWALLTDLTNLVVF